jgi:hypothetical protein
VITVEVNFLPLLPLSQKNDRLGRNQHVSYAPANMLMMTMMTMLMMTMTMMVLMMTMMVVVVVVTVVAVLPLVVFWHSAIPSFA